MSAGEEQKTFPRSALEPEAVRRGVRREKSSLVSRNVTVLGHRTSVRLEPEM